MSLVTISSGIGCRSHEIARLLSKKLNLELFDDKRIQEEAEIINREKSDYKIIEEKAPALIERLMIINPESYYFYTESVILGIAQKGYGIIIGHASQMLLKDCSCVFKVKIHAPFEVRVKEVMKMQKVDKDEAKKYIKENDGSQKKFFQYIFKNDFDSAMLYDLVVNTDKISIESAADIIIDALNKLKIKECSIDTLNSLKRTSLEKNILSRLMVKNMNVDDLNILFTGMDRVKVTGSVSDFDEIELVENIIKNTEGISSVDTDDLMIHNRIDGLSV